VACGTGRAALDLTGFEQDADVPYFYHVRAVSAAGVEERNTSSVVSVTIDGDGLLVGPAPGRVTLASLTPAAGGTFVLQFVYRRRGAKGEASAVWVKNGAELLKAIPIAASDCKRRVLLSEDFADGAEVTLTLVAVTTLGTPGPESTVAGTADASAPAEVSDFTAEEL
jgi:hypothetical protein